MKRYIPILCAVVLLVASSVLAGEPFPDVTLSGQLTADQRAYLGVSSDEFKISDIKGEYLFIEGYSMYCPICQRDAPRVNAVFDTISAADTKGQIKFVGIALGNTAYEVAFYQKKYTVDFPIFKDENYTIHKALGEVGTPTFYIVKLGPTPEILYKHVGEAKDKNVLLQVIKEKTGLN